MKKIIFLLIVTLIFSCGRKTAKNSDLAALKSEHDSLLAILKETGNKISELEKQIMQLDSAAQKQFTLVTSQIIQRKKFEHFFEVQASVESDKSVNIYAEIPSVIKQIQVATGQQVSHAQTLVVLDTEVLQKNREELKASYDLAKTIFLKQETLWSQKIGSEIQYLEAKNRKESLELKLKTLNAQLEKSTITAPFSGIIDEIFMKQGEMAVPMMPLIRLVNLNEIYLKAEVSEDYLGKVKNGTPVVAEFPSLGVKFNGTVNFTGNYINPGNRTFRLNIAIQNTDGMFKPNLIANVKILDFERDSAIAVPSDVILQDAQNNEYVFTVDRSDGTKAVKKIVQTGISYNNETLIKSGLNANAEIIVQGARNVRDGESVVVGQ